jgi:hypothetical protein
MIRAPRADHAEQRMKTRLSIDVVAEKFFERQLPILASFEALPAPLNLIDPRRLPTRIPACRDDLLGEQLPIGIRQLHHGFADFFQGASHRIQCIEERAGQQLNNVILAKPVEERVRKSISTKRRSPRLPIGYLSGASRICSIAWSIERECLRGDFAARLVPFTRFGELLVRFGMKP